MQRFTRLKNHGPSMLKKLLTIVATLLATASLVAVDLNTANEAELDGVRGIGPGLSGRILAERQQGEFKDWQDFIGRVQGVGNQSAARLSREGLTVGGKKFSAAAAKAEARSKKHGNTSARSQDGGEAPADSGRPPAAPPTAPASVSSAGASKN